MEQRRIFKCWSCRRNFSLLRKIDGQMQIEIVCPFCYKEGVVDLGPYNNPCSEIFRSSAPHHCPKSHEVNFPEVIMTTESAD